MSYPQTCQCKEDWTDGTGICQECHLKRINTQADLHAVVDFIRETEKLEAQVAEWMGVANQQILRIQELEQERDSAQALLKDAVEVLSSAYLLLSRAGHNWVGEYDFDEHKVLDGGKKCITAFLSRPEVKAMGGGK